MKFLTMPIGSCNSYIQFSIRSLLKTYSGSSLIGWRDKAGWLSTMVPTFKNKAIITNLYSMNPLDSRGYYFFTTLEMRPNRREMVDGLLEVR
jgi:hypothetical protein